MKCSVCKLRVDRLQKETIRNEYQAELGVQTNDFFQTLGNLHQEGVTGVEFVHKMASKSEKLVDKADTTSWVASLLFMVHRSVSYM